MRGLRDHLRSRTRDRHEQVDNLFSRLNLADLVGYRTFLKAQFLGHKRVLTAMQCPDSRAAVRYRLSLLESDLMDIQSDLPGLGVSPEPPAAFDGRGLIYVIAGSHLGAQVLRKDWLRSEDDTVRGAGAFLNDRSLAPVWSSLLQDFSEDNTDSDTADKMVTGARWAFEQFECAFKQVAA